MLAKTPVKTKVPMSSTAYPYRVTVPPVGDPLFITLAKARTYLRLTTADISDDDLTAFIKAAQAAAERFTRLTFFTTRFETTRDFFWTEIMLNRAPLESITSVERLISDVLTAVDSSVYKAIDTDVLNYGSIVLKAGESWPCDQDAEARAITITFDAGFGTAASDLPADLITGISRVLADLYENRGDCSCDSTGGLASMSNSAKMLLDRFKIMTV